MFKTWEKWEKEVNAQRAGTVFRKISRGAKLRDAAWRAVGDPGARNSKDLEHVACSLSRRHHEILRATYVFVTYVRYPSPPRPTHA